MTRTVLVEALHMVTGVVVTMTIFAAAAWGYPQGTAAFYTIGAVTTLVVLAMSVKPLLKALRPA